MRKKGQINGRSKVTKIIGAFREYAKAPNRIGHIRMLKYRDAFALPLLLLLLLSLAETQGFFCINDCPTRCNTKQSNLP